MTPDRPPAREGLSLYALPRAHPFNWADEARIMLLSQLLLPAMQLPSVVREAQGAQGVGEPWAKLGDDDNTAADYPSPDPRRVVEAFFAHYAQLEVGPRVHLGMAVNNPLVISAEHGLTAWPYTLENDPEFYDPVAYLVGRGIRAAAVQAVRACRGLDPIGLLQAQPPALTRALDRLHTFLTNAAVHFYHRQGAELHGYLLDKQLVELMLEG